MTDKHSCIFCKITHKEIPAYTVYEDEHFLAFLDIQPQASGHVQVIPKEHFRWVWDVPYIQQYFTVVQKLAKALQKSYSVQLIRSQVFGEEVEHAHVWLWPYQKSDGKEKDFIFHQEKIKNALSAKS